MHLTKNARATHCIRPVAVGVPRPSSRFRVRFRADSCACACYNPLYGGIVGIHRIAQQFRGGYQLKDVWHNGIRDGLMAAGHPTTAATLVQDDVQVRVFRRPVRPQGTIAAGGPPYSVFRVGPSRLSTAEAPGTHRGNAAYRLLVRGELLWPGRCNAVRSRPPPGEATCPGDVTTRRAGRTRPRHVWPSA